jgi:hypothetical protein
MSHPSPEFQAMDATATFKLYAERAKAAACPACRTVNMLGMMCAAAVDNGGFLAFVGQGYGGDWPDPRDNVATRRNGEPKGDLKD